MKFFLVFPEKRRKTFLSLLHSEMDSRIPELTGHWEMCLFDASISFHIVMWTLPETDGMERCARVRSGSMKRPGAWGEKRDLMLLPFMRNAFCFDFNLQ